MNTKTYIHRFPQRTATLQITEHVDHIEVVLRLDRYDGVDDRAEFRQWIHGILYPYENDPRPLIFDNPHNGDTITVYGDATHSVAVVQHPLT